MSQTEPSFQELDATPVGPSGTRVQIHEHEAWTINGWWGVLAVAVCAGIIIVLSLGLRQSLDQPADRRGRRHHRLVGHRPTRSDQGGPVLRQLRRHGAQDGPVVDSTIDQAPRRQHSGSQLRNEPFEGE
jgi:hypothetical protein